jgi:hypothetical protein
MSLIPVVFRWISSRSDWSPPTICVIDLLGPSDASTVTPVVARIQPNKSKLLLRPEPSKNVLGEPVFVLRGG